MSAVAPPAAWTPWQVVRSSFARARGTTGLAALMVAIHQVCEASTPVIVGLALDDSIAKGSMSGTWKWIALLAGMYVILSLCGNGAGPVSVRARTRAEHDARQLIVARALDPRGSAISRTAGETLSIASSDAQKVGEGVNGVTSGFSSIAALGVATAALFWSSPTLGFVSLICVLAVVFATPFLAGRLQRRSATQQAAAADAAGVAVDLIEGVRVIKGIGAQRTAGERYRTLSQASRHARVQAGAAESLFEGVTTTIAGFLLLAVAGVGALLALNGELTPGQLVAGIGLAQFLVGPVARLSYAGTVLATVRASATRIAEVLNTPFATPDVNSAGEPGSSSSATVDSASLVLTQVGGSALSGLTLEADPGELIAVVVDDLAERAELLDVLARRAEPASGQVLLGGADIVSLPLAEVRERLMVIPHEPALFTEPLVDLVGERANAALAASSASEIAEQLADQGTVHAGRNLSGGQRQRLALARALAANPPVLVLDDPTSALDVATEAQVAQGLRELRASAGSGDGPRTTIIMSTSASIVAVADRVYFVRDGSVAHAGSHAELVAIPEYARVVLR